MGRALTDVQELKQDWFGNGGSNHLTFMVPNNFCDVFKHNLESWPPTDMCVLQVAGGTDIIRKTIAAFSPQNMDTKVVIDAISFDGWPALACLEDCQYSSLHTFWFSSSIWEIPHQVKSFCFFVRPILHPFAPQQENTLGGRFLCASVVLDVQVEPISKHLAHAVYDKSRSGALELQGFPNFDPLVQSLRAGVPMTDPPQYQVCAPVPWPVIPFLKC